MPLSRGAVIDYLADLSEQELEEVLRRAKQKLQIVSNGSVCMKLAGIAWNWSHQLQSVRCSHSMVDRILRSHVGDSEDLRRLVIDLRSFDADYYHWLFGDTLPAYRCRISLLDAAVLAGDRRLVSKLVSLKVPQVLRFELGDFLNPHTGIMHEKGAQILEAAICAGVNVRSLTGAWTHAFFCHPLSGDCSLDGLQERAIAGRQRKAALLLRRCGAVGTFRGDAGCSLFKVVLDTAGAAMFFLDVRRLDLALELGIDLRLVRVNPAFALELACHNHGKDYKMKALYMGSRRMGVAWETPKTLLEMAILCGQDGVAQRLASLGFDAGGLTSEGLRSGFELAWQDWLSDLRAFNDNSQPLETAMRVYLQVRGKYHVPILQLARWWQRARDGSGSSFVVVQHARLVEYIAEFALPIPRLPEFAQAQHRACLQAAAPSASGAEAGHQLMAQIDQLQAREEEAEEEEEEVEEQEEALAQSEPVAQIDPLEAAAVAEERWASGVEALCARQGALAASSTDLEVVVLTFGRDGLAFDEAVLGSPPALRAVAAGVDVKPGWANGAKVLVPGIGASEVEEARIALLPRHVVALAGDQEEILDALTSLPSRSRPQLKPVSPVVSVPAPGDVSLFADVGGGSSHTNDVAWCPGLTSGSPSAGSREGDRTPVPPASEAQSRVPSRLIVKWTFLEVVEESPTDVPQSSRSI